MSRARPTDLATDLATDLSTRTAGGDRRPRPSSRPSPAPTRADDADFREFYTDLVEREPSTPPPAAESLSPEADDDGDQVDGHAVDYRDVDLDGGVSFGTFHKSGKLYFAPFVAPVRVETPVLRVLGDLRGADATLALSGGFGAFVEGAEAALFRHAVAHPEWTNRGESELRRYFKSFVGDDGGQACVRVKVADDLAVFDAEGGIVDDPADVGPGTGLRCLLELDGIWFGRRGFGAMWTLTQAQVAAAPRLLLARRRRGAPAEFS